MAKGLVSLYEAVVIGKPMTRLVRSLNAFGESTSFAAVPGRLEGLELLRERQLGLASYAKEDAAFDDLDGGGHASRQTRGACDRRRQSHRQAIAPFLDGLLGLDVVGWSGFLVHVKRHSIFSISPYQRVETTRALPRIC